MTDPFNAIRSRRGRAPRQLVVSSIAVLAWATWTGGAAELQLDFGQFREGEPPAGYRSVVTGAGEPGDWRILHEDLEPGRTNQLKSSVTVQRAVLAQLSRDPTDERFPLLIYDGQKFDDFTLTLRFKTVEGTAEQMAGVAFRIQDETNYYVVRASSLGNTFRFYKFVDGVRSPPLGVEVPVPRGVWHEMTVECQGNQIRCFLNGQPLIPALTDNSFTEGKIGFWTKSDSVSRFADVRIVYRPKEILAKALLRQALKDYPRLLGLKIYARKGDAATPEIIASDEAAEVGRPGGSVEADVVERGTVYYGKEGNRVSVVLPLVDRNGEPAAAVRVVMKSFPGQTQDNALVRARPIARQIQAHIRSAKDLVE